MYRNTGVLVALVVLGVFLAAGVSGDKYPDKEGSHKISKGSRKTSFNKVTDLLLYHNSLRVESGLFPFPLVKEQDLCYPTKGSKQAKFTITAFSVEDTGNTGLVYLKEDKHSGVGKNKVCFHFKSLRGKGYHYNIDIYGTYD